MNGPSFSYVVLNPPIHPLAMVIGDYLPVVGAAKHWAVRTVDSSVAGRRAQFAYHRKD
jgi:hypothetical protein